MKKQKKMSDHQVLPDGHVLRREDGHVLRREDGHVLRRKDGHILRRASEFEVEYQRKVGKNMEEEQNKTQVTFFLPNFFHLCHILQ